MTEGSILFFRDCTYSFWSKTKNELCCIKRLLAAFTFATFQSSVSGEARPTLLSVFSLSARVSILTRLSSLSRKTQEARQPLGS